MNKYLKRGAAIALTGAMCLSMAACGEKGGSKSGKNDTKTLAQELGYGYLSEYHELDTDLDWINSNNVTTVQGKMYFAGQYYDDAAGQSGVRLYCADPATGEVTEIPMAALESSDTSNQNLQALTVSPDGGSYWTIIATYTFPAYDDTAVYDETAVTDEFANGVGTIDATAKAETTEETPTEEAATAEAPAEDTAGEETPAEEAPTEEAEAPIDDTAEASTAEKPAVDEGYTGGDSQETYTAYKYDMNGNQLLEIDLTDIVSSDQDWFYPQYVAQDGEGNLYIASDSKIYCFGADGSEKEHIDMENQWIMNMISTGDGTVVAEYFADGEGSATLCKVESGKLGDPITISGDGNFSNMNVYPGTGSTLMASDGNFLYSVNINTGASTKMLSWLDSDINATNLSGVAAASEDQILVLCSRFSVKGNDTYELGTLTKTPASEIPERTLLTLGAEYLDSNIKDAVIDYNRKSNDYRITLVDYSQYNTEDDYTLGAQQLDRDVVSGNCPDIISITSGHQEKYIAKGALADLSALMEKDDSISQDDLVAGALKAYISDGKLYGMPYNFSLQTLIASVKLVGDRTSWNMADMAQVIDGLDDTVSVMEYTTQTEFLQQMVYQNINQFVDYGKATCSFDSDAFKQLLTASAKLPTNDELYGDNDSISVSSDDTYQQLQSGDLLLTTSYISGDSYSIKEFYGLYNNKDFGMVNIGYPTDEGSGVQISVGGGLAISAKSKYTDAAWDFIKTLLSDDFQTDQWGFPVTKTAFDKAMAATMEKDSYTDENGEKVYYDQTTYIGDTEYTIPPLTQEQVDDFKAMVDNASVGGNYDSDILDIINEEAAAFFSGDKSADDVAALIQNRVSIYLGETS